MKLHDINTDGTQSQGPFATIYEATAPFWPQQVSDNLIRSPQFRHWLKGLGIDGPIGKPMSGAVGRAYPVGSSAVVKFTTDKGEANAAAVFHGYGQPLDHTADVHSIHLVGSVKSSNGDDRDLYAIIMQRLDTGVGKRMRIAGNAVYSYLDDFSGFIEDPNAVYKVVMAKYVDKKLRDDAGIQYSVKQIINALYDVQSKTGILSQDTHGGNIAFKNRKPAFFDFGRSSINSKVDRPRITQLAEI